MPLTSSNRVLKIATVAASLALVSGCSLLPAPVPMKKIVEVEQSNAKCFVLLLPGAGDHAKTFREQGFIDLLTGSGASLEVVAADATMGYYFKGVAAERIETDVMGPLLAVPHRADQKVWLIGPSMGGFGSLHYAQRVGHIDGVLAIAPYLGDSSIADEVQRAGGLKAWPADKKEPITEKNYQRQLWSWLHRVVTGEEPGPSIYVGWGTGDDLGVAGAVVGRALPEGHVFHAEGPHDWAPWRDVLKQFLKTEEFQKSCAPGN